MSRRDGPRPVAIWCWVYLSFFMALFPLASIAFSLWAGSVSRSNWAGEGSWESAADLESTVEMWATVVFSLATSIFCGVGPFLSRKRSTWIYGIIQLTVPVFCLCLCLFVLTIPMLIFWCRNDVRDWVENKSPDDLIDVFD